MPANPTKYPGAAAATVLKWFWHAAIGLVVVVILFFFGLSFANLPSFDDLENPQVAQASEALYIDKSTMGRFFRQNRVSIPYEEMNPYIVEALLATEDERYYRHSGIDFLALGRVGIKTVLMGKSSGGGSTITQQLAKLLYPRVDTRSMGALKARMHLAMAKFKEWITAVKLERAYTKEEIMAMYLNKADFIYDSYGVKAAAETYFGKDQGLLNINEAAVIVGMLKNPLEFNPRRNPNNSFDRRNVVLHQMLKHDYITREQYDSLKLTQIDISGFLRLSQSAGAAPYLMVVIQERVKALLQQPENMQPDGTPYDLFGDGLKIYTTIDSRYQEFALKAVEEHMPKLQQTFWKHWGKTDPITYKVEKEQLELRKVQLWNLVKETDRYQNMRIQYLKGPLTKLKEEVGDLVYTDNEIRWMMEEEKKPGTLAGLRSKGTISSEKIGKLKAVMTSPYWQDLKKQQAKFAKDVVKHFDTKVKCKVFDYTPPLYQKDTLLSPLDSIKYMLSFLQCGVMAMDPRSGHVKAWVGGVNHQNFKFDHVTSNRQVGSTFKPFVYTTAVLNNISPCHQVVDQPYTISPGENNFTLLQSWTPQNASGFSGKSMNLYSGLEHSVNSISVWLMKQFGSAEPVRQTAISMGIDGQKVPNVPSICLGTPELTVEELTSAYATFANNGEYIEPTIILRIEDKFGKTIFAAKQNRHRALSTKSNYVMITLLNASKGRMPGELKSDIAGKTGTTNDHADGWFMGITPNVAIGTWVGGDMQWIRFRDLLLGQGSAMAKPIFIHMLKNLESLPISEFDPAVRFFHPEGDLGVTINCAEYRSEVRDPFSNTEEMEDAFEVPKKNNSSDNQER